MADDNLTGVLSLLLGSGAPEVTCEQCFDGLDRYVESVLSGHDADAQIPGMAAHLAGCPACHEDYLSLRDFVAGSATDASPAPESEGGR